MNMKWQYVRSRDLLGTLGILAIGGALQSLYPCTDWFAKFGSLLVIMGILVAAKNDWEPIETLWGGTAFSEPEGPSPELLRKQQATAVLLFTAVGTFVWGFGDLPFKLLE